MEVTLPNEYHKLVEVFIFYLHRSGGLQITSLIAYVIVSEFVTLEIK